MLFVTASQTGRIGLLPSTWPSSVRTHWKILFSKRLWRLNNTKEGSFASSQKKLGSRSGLIPTDYWKRALTASRQALPRLRGLACQKPSPTRECSTRSCFWIARRWTCVGRKLWSWPNGLYHNTYESYVRLHVVALRLNSEQALSRHDLLLRHVVGQACLSGDVSGSFMQFGFLVVFSLQLLLHSFLLLILHFLLIIKLSSDLVLPLFASFHLFGLWVVQCLFLFMDLL